MNTLSELYKLEDRKKIPIYTKWKPKPKEARHLVKYKDEKDYDYYKCDYCNSEIKILKGVKRYEMLGGIAILPGTLTKRGNIKLVLCCKCLNPVVRLFEGNRE